MLSVLICAVTTAEGAAVQSIAQHPLPHDTKVLVTATPEELVTLVSDAKPDSVLIFISDTMILEPFAIEAFVQRLRHPGVGAAVGRCLDASGLLVKSAAYGLQQGKLAVALNGVTRDHTLALRPRDCDLGGFPLAVRADVLESCGGIAGPYQNRYYDVDISLRVRMLGKRVVYSPDAIVRDLDPAAGWSAGSAADALLFLARFPDVFVPPLEPLTFAA